jgi:hypothetical protein
MPNNGPGLWAARKAAMDAVSNAYTQSTDAADAVAYRNALGEADSQAILDYIQTHTEIQAGEHTGTITTID